MFSSNKYFILPQYEQAGNKTQTYQCQIRNKKPLNPIG